MVITSCLAHLLLQSSWLLHDPVWTRFSLCTPKRIWENRIPFFASHLQAFLLRTCLFRMPKIYFKCPHAQHSLNFSFLSLECSLTIHPTLFTPSKTDSSPLSLPTFPVFVSLTQFLKGLFSLISVFRLTHCSSTLCPAMLQR